MEKVAVVFTVFFEEPFWCGVYQRQEGRNLEAARIFATELETAALWEYG